ncbi:hypothetical protein [Serratia fonticola]|uniref:hypothetical protein n=1 Tax=Serratia fonticola TaxID=47917 RepID=UPI0004113880|nr:hypothetical protein [Serratia fonticola]
MKDKDYFFDGLSAEFERHFARIVDSEPGVDQFINDANAILKRHKNGFRAGNMGNFINNNDEYIDENGEVISIEEIDKKYDGGRGKEYLFEWFPVAGLDCPVSEMRSPLLREGDPETSINEFIMKAYVCYHWGIHQKKSGMHEESRQTLLQSLRFLNMRDGAYDALDIKKILDEMELERKSASSRGGKSKKENYTLFKLEVIKLLLNNKPNNGWENKKSAINSLLPELNKFMKNEQRKLDLEGKKEKLSYYATEETLYKRIYDWSIKDDIIKAIFSEVVK